MRDCCLPNDYARRNVDVDSPASVWRLIIGNFILEHIIKCTIGETFHQTENEKFTFNIENLESFIVILYGRGVSRKNHLPMQEAWKRNWEITLCQEAMPKNRLCEIFRFNRFDKRLKTDESALHSVVWKRFIENSIASYKAGGFVSVDEQLFPSKARCPFTQFMPLKSDKYGRKY